MEPQWYYTLSGQQQGPVPESQLRALLQSGQVSANEFVFKEGMTDWAAASSCPDLAGGGPPAAPAVAVVAQRAGVGEVSIGSIYQEAIAVFKESWLALCLGMLICFAISFGVGFVSGIISYILRDEHLILSRLVGFAINGPIYYGGWFLFLKAVDRRQPSPTDVIEGFKYFVPAFVLNLLMTIAVFVGLLAVIIGAIIVAILLTFSWGYMVDQRLSPIDSMKQSFQCVKSNFVTVLVLMLMGIPIMFAGLLCFVVGMIPAAAFWGLTMAIAYRWLNPQTPAIS